MKPYQEVAVSFASALVAGDFSRARRLLAPAIRQSMTEEALRTRLTKMYSGYDSGPPTRVDFDEEGSSDSPYQLDPGDVGWAYVSISGDHFVEAVTVTVADIDGALLIREIEWGRP